MELIKSKKPKTISGEHEQLMKELGRRIKKLRTDKEISYVKMANEIGLSRNEYNLMELGKIYFKFSTLLQVLDYHKISVTEFFKEL